MGLVLDAAPAGLQGHDAGRLVTVRTFNHVYFDGHTNTQPVEGAPDYRMAYEVNRLIFANIDKTVPLVGDQVHDFSRQAWSDFGGLQALLVQLATLATIIRQFTL